jgi:hypothetical protein
LEASCPQTSLKISWTVSCIYPQHIYIAQPPGVANRREIVATNIITSKGYCMLGKNKTPYRAWHDSKESKADTITQVQNIPLIHQKEPKFKTQRETHHKKARETETHKPHLQAETWW